MSRMLPLDTPAEVLAALGKDPRLVPYGGGNFGMPLEFMEPDGALIVDNDRFFLRSNGAVPEIAPGEWSLAVSGHVDRPLFLSYADLAAMPSRRMVSVLECAGNARTGFDPVPDGTPWRHDAAGCALWEGVPLAAVLDLADIRHGAVDVVAQGGDFPEMQRGLPIHVARDPDTLLVLRMNGEPLPTGHGGPVRLLVPGWAGIASTKWIVGLDVLDRAFDGVWNTKNYVIWSGDGEALRPVEAMPPRSVISAPLAGSSVPPGRLSVSGYAWSGQGAISRVEISTDDGGSWRAVPFAPQPRRSWVRWTAEVEAAPGPLAILARATDERTISQPRAAAWNLKGYQNNSIQRITLVVEG